MGVDRRIPGRDTKKIARAVDEAALSGRIDEPHLLAVHQAQFINHASGGVVIAPWEIGALPDEWLYTFEALYARRFSKIDQNIRALEDTKARWRAQFRIKH